MRNSFQTREEYIKYCNTPKILRFFRYSWLDMFLDWVLGNDEEC